MITQGLLDTDLYKLTMQQAVCRLFPTAEVTYKLFNRGGHELSEEQAQLIDDSISDMESIKLRDSEAEYLKSLRYMTPQYVDFLRGYRFDRSEVKLIYEGPKNWNLFVSGPWYRTILWETPLLAIVSEVITAEPMTKSTILYQKELAEQKAKTFKESDIKFAEFGTRRRASYELQEMVLYSLMDATDTLVGTSNVSLAKLFDLTPVGTHAHEWYMFHAAKYGYKFANKRAMDSWSYVYDGDLGIALSDTFTSDIFFKDFTMKYAKLFDGIRHDSGSPIHFAYKAVKKYESLGINPKHKTIVFSDSISSTDKAVGIKKNLDERINCSFGIGTYLTNDLYKKAPNIAMKMIWARDKDFRAQPTIKISDTRGKSMGPQMEIQRCLKDYQVEDQVDSLKR